MANFNKTEKYFSFICEKCFKQEKVRKGEQSLLSDNFGHFYPKKIF